MGLYSLNYELQNESFMAVLFSKCTWNRRKSNIVKLEIYDLCFFPYIILVIKLRSLGWALQND
jgi:hypothetical protein